MSSISSLIVFLAILLYFLYNTIRSVKRRKKLHAQGTFVEFNHFTLSFYVYIICDIVLLGYLIYNFKNLDILEIVMAIIFLIFIAISSYTSTRIIIANNGLNYMYYYIEYKNLSDIRIQKYKGEKYAIGFFNKNGKMIFSLKLREPQMHTLKDFVSRRKVQIYEI